MTEMAETWTEESIRELLDAVGQEIIKFNTMHTNRGTSNGDYGRVTFFTMADDQELRLVFETSEDAKQAFSAFSAALTDYEFTNRFDVMPEVIMVTFTEG